MVVSTKVVDMFISATRKEMVLDHGINNTYWLSIFSA